MAIADSQTPFIWGQGGVALTPEQVARQREVAALLTQGGADYSPVQHWLQGAARLAQGGLGGLLAYRANENETAGRQGFQSRWNDVFGSGQTASVDPVAAALTSAPQTASDATAALASVPSGEQASYIRQGLISRGLPEHIADAFLLNFQDESGLNSGINEAAPTVPGSRGGYGLYQLTGPRRVAYEQYARQMGVDPSNVDAQLDFMMSELQGPEAKAAQAIFAAPDTGSAAAAIVNQFLRPAEEHRARRAASYTGGSYPQLAQVGGMASPDIASLIGLASDPWANDAQRSIVQSLLGQQIEQQDPRYQQQLALGDLQMQQAQAELEALLNPPAPAPVFEGGQWWDLSGGSPNALTDRAVDPTSLMQNLEAAGLTPGTPEYAQAIIDSVTKPNAQVENIIQPNAGDDSFFSGLNASEGKVYSGFLENAPNAARNLSQLDQLEGLLANTPQGFEAAATQFAGNFGIDLGNATGVQAAQALINQLVPAQRPPGSGPMSDADLELFKQSVPRLINQPGGNETIIQTMRAINQYDLALAQITQEGLTAADMATTPQERAAIRADMRAKISALQNPLEGFDDRMTGFSSGSTPQRPALSQSQAPQVSTQEQYDALPSGSPYMAPDGTIRTKR